MDCQKNQYKWQFLHKCFGWNTLWRECVWGEMRSVLCTIWFNDFPTSPKKACSTPMKTRSKELLNSPPVIVSSYYDAKMTRPHIHIGTNSKAHGACKWLQVVFQAIHPCQKILLHPHQANRSRSTKTTICRWEPTFISSTIFRGWTYIFFWQCNLLHFFHLRRHRKHDKEDTGWSLPGTW